VSQLINFIELTSQENHLLPIQLHDKQLHCI
jgi:hypothetical protein